MLIAQISDLHVRRPGQLYMDLVDSNRMLVNAIHHLHGLDQRPDLVLITGDVVDEGHPEEYEHALALLRTLEVPWTVIPGNHDEREAFRKAFSPHVHWPAEGPLHHVRDEPTLRVVALDVCVPGQHHGGLDETGLAWLARTLALAPDKPTLVLMHHPPFESGIAYLDKYRFVEDQALAAIIQASPQVQAVLCGHVHRAMARRWAGTVVLTCPSTTSEIALQLSPNAKPQSYLGPPACLLHVWQPGSGLVTHTSFIGEAPGPFPFF